jgi:hypothetical protein
MAPVRISLEVLDKLSSLSLSAAAFRLGISPTAMKKSCRKLGVTRWPYQSGKTSSATTIEGSRENTAPNAKYPAHLVENTAVSLAYQSNSGTFSSDSSSSGSISRLPSTDTDLGDSDFNATPTFTCDENVLEEEPVMVLARMEAARGVTYGSPHLHMFW